LRKIEKPDTSILSRILSDKLSLEQALEKAGLELKGVGA